MCANHYFYSAFLFDYVHLPLPKNQKWVSVNGFSALSPLFSSICYIVFDLCTILCDYNNYSY